MEYNTQKYRFNQDGRDYVVSTGLVGDRVRITCQGSLALDGPFYSNEFSLDDLRRANQFFMLPQTPQEALLEINKGIERQKSGLSQGTNDTMIFIGYLVIGTDNDAYNLPLRRDYEPNKYGIFTPPSSGAADLVLQSNYQVDGGRLNLNEAKCGDLQSEQTALEEELNRLIPEINKLRKLSLDIKEENALIKERLKILQEQLEERKRSVFKLKEENEILKRENQELSNYIKQQENAIRERQAIQTTIKVKSRPNISHGKSAITSKFEQSALRTFLPRAAIKPITEDYIQNTTYIDSKPTTIITTPTTQTQPTQQYVIGPTTEKTLETKYLPTIYRQEKIISRLPIIIKDEAPDVTYSTKPNIGDDMKYSASTYTTSNPVYIYNNPITKTATFISKVPDVKDIPYTSQLGNERDIHYTSEMAKTGGVRAKDVSYTSHFGAERDVAYSTKFGKGGDTEKDAPYTTKFGKGGDTEKDAPYTSHFGAERDVAYSTKFGKGGDTEKDAPYTSHFGAERDVPYTSKLGRGEDRGKDAPYTSKFGAERDLPYSTKMARKNTGDKDKPYTSHFGAERDVAYESSRVGNKDKNVPYSSQMARGDNNVSQAQKDGPYSSQMSNNSNLGGYSSQMANNLGDSTNAGYSSQMAQTSEKFIQGNYNKRPKGSRAPNVSNNKTQSKKPPDVGYSSYK